MSDIEINEVEETVEAVEEVESAIVVTEDAEIDGTIDESSVTVELEAEEKPKLSDEVAANALTYDAWMEAEGNRLIKRGAGVKKFISIAAKAAGDARPYNEIAGELGENTRKPYAEIARILFSK